MNRLNMIAISLAAYILLFGISPQAYAEKQAPPPGQPFQAIMDQIEELKAQVAVEQVYVKNLGSQPFILDQQLRPEDSTCQSGLFCTSYQIISESTIGSINVSEPSTLFVTFNGNYNWDGSAMLLDSPYVSIQLQISANGDPFETVTMSSGNWIPNHGADVVQRRAIYVEEGEYTLQILHRFTVFSTESPLIDAFSFLGGAISVEVLK
jgi:hypothetical protein